MRFAARGSLTVKAAGSWSVTVAIVAGTLASIVGCTSIDPGPNYIVPPEDFNADYFYCFVEPQLILGAGNGGRSCGSGANVPGATSGGCHFSDKVPEMELQDHVPVTCANGHPTDATETGPGSPAASNLSAVSSEMDSDWMNAPLYIWPTQLVGGAHPVQVFTPSSTVVKYISAWATE